MSYFLIGGKSLDSNNSLERILLSLTKKRKPRLILITLAMKDKPKTILNYHNYFNNLDLEIIDLPLFNTNLKLNEIKNILNTADIIYFTGGSTTFLLSELEKLNLIDYIKELSLKDDLILAGVSAGAILFSKAGMTDYLCYNDYNHTYGFKMEKALDMLDLAICPHYQKEDLYVFNLEVKNYNLAVALEDDTAIYIKNNIMIPFKGDKRHSIYIFRKEDEYRMKSVYQWKSLSVLGPKGTYSTLAGDLFLDKFGIDLDIDYYSSIRKAGMAIKDSGIGVLPIENTLDGYVQETLDLVYENDYHIIADLNLKVEFAFIANTSDLSKVKKVYAQFKARGQCLDFLDSYNFDISETDSNITSLNKFEEELEPCGAIIPMHALKKEYATVIKNCEDSKNNYTRFIVVTKDDLKMQVPKNFKASLILEAKNDHPGILYNLLAMFSIFDINLNAIMSRPTKEMLGRYYFYIEFSNKKENYDSILNVIDLIQKKADFKVTLLGIYDNLTKED